MMVKIQAMMRSVFPMVKRGFLTRWFLLSWFLLGWFLLGVPHSMQAQAPAGTMVRSFRQEAALRGASVGIYMAELSSGKILMSEGAGLLLAPASTLKTVTTAAALELLGPGYRFRTVYGYHGRIDTEKGWLEGDLVVRGGGDPTLGSSAMEEALSPEAVATRIIGRLKQNGITTIGGDLVVDISAYPEGEIPGSWAWEDVGNYYGAGASALTFADNTISLFFDTPARSGEPVTLVREEPRVPWVRWQNELKSSSVNRDLAWIYGSPWGAERVIRGTIPAGQKDYSIKASLPEPPRWFGTFLSSSLTAAGIAFQGKVIVADHPAELVPLDTLYSPPLSRIIKEINHKSVNLYAEHLVLQMALEKTGKGDLAQGLQTMTSFWKEKGVAEGLILEDGSGLSRFNAITAHTLVRILTLAAQGPQGPVFRSSLPTAGNGTLSGFTSTDFPATTLQCKSGSMERVRAYAGYLRCASGRDIVFAILVNNFPGTAQEVTAKIRELLRETRRKY